MIGNAGRRRRTRIASFGLVALMAVGSACSQASTTALVSTPDAFVTSEATRPISRTHEAPHLLVDRADPDVVYLSEVEMQSGQCRFYVSTDGGSRWVRSEAAPSLPPYTNCNFGSSQPQNVRTELSQAPDGTIYYAYAANDPGAGGTRSILVGRSADGGSTWDTTLVHGGPKATDPLDIEVNFEPHLALDPASPEKLYVTWRRSYPRVEGRDETPPTRPWMAVSTDGGATFGAPFMMLDTDIGFDAPRLVVDGGTVTAFYRARTSGEPNALRASRSADDGRTWEHATIVTAGDASEPIPAYDHDEQRYHVVWHDNTNGDLDVFYATSRDAVTWSEPHRLNDDALGNRVGQYYPQISLGPDRRVDIAWYDYRDDPYPAPEPDEEGEALGLGSNLGRTQSVYYLTSTDGGESWSTNLRVNDVVIDRTIGTWNGQYFVVVPVSIASTDAGALVAWSDTRNGNVDNQAQDIYSSLVRFDTSEAEVSRWGIGLAGFLLGAGVVMVAVLGVLRSRSA